jgi:hypothetical protein
MSAVSADQPTVSWLRAVWLTFWYYAGVHDGEGRSVASRFGWVLLAAAAVAVVVAVLLAGVEPVVAKFCWGRPT